MNSYFPGGATVSKTEIRPLTGVRSFAAALVVFGHFFNLWFLLLPSIWWLTRFCAKCFIGVDLFFMLSGFILSYVYYNPHKPQLGWNKYKHFIWHRFVRVWPIHVATLLILGLMVGGAKLISVPVAGRYPLSALPFQITMTHAWPYPPGSGMDPYGAWSWNYPSWSISAEWFAYLFIFPVIYLVFNFSQGREKTSFVLCYLVLMVWGCFIDPPNQTWYSMVGRITFEFSAGCFLYNVFSMGGRITHACQRWCDLLFALILIVMLAYPMNLPVPRFICVFLFPVFILGLTSEESFTAKLFSSPAMLWLGRVSFSLYMTQAISQKIIKIILPAERYQTASICLRLGIVAGTLALIIGFAAALHYLVENPSRNFLRNVVESRIFGQAKKVI